METSGNYWNRYALSRRRLLASGASLGLGTVALSVLGCGSDEGNPDDSSSAGSLVTKATDRSSGAKAGGIASFHVTQQTLSFDHLTHPRTASTHADLTYSRLFKFVPGTADDPPTGKFEGDAVESWELADDGLKLIMKLRPNLRLDPRPPTNGRTLTSEDVKWSWDRFSARGTQRADYNNTINPDAPIRSVETPDARTVIMNLAFPYAPLFSLLGFTRGLAIMPTEAEGGFNPDIEIRGSGAWMLTKSTSDVGYEFRKNPNWYDAGQVLLDGINRPILPEYASRLAQFRAGVLATTDVSADDLLTIKAEEPRLDLFLRGFSFAMYMFGFSAKADSPFKDIRLRRALSMMIDRDLWIDALSNVADFEKAGVGREVRWHSHLSSAWDKYWVDPKSKDFGSGAKYFKYDVKEAKALLEAASLSNVTLPNTFYTGYPTREHEAITQMWIEAGVKVDSKPLPQAEWVQACHTAGGNWDGLCVVPDGPGADIDVTFSTRVRGGATQYSLYGPNVYSKIDELVLASRRELDDDKRTRLIRQDLQKELAEQMPFINFPGHAEQVELVHPWLANYGYLRPQTGGCAGQETYPKFWIDEARKTP